MTSSPSSSRLPADDFATTQWSVVLQAGRGDGALARTSLERLCHVYWLPIYAYVRRRARDAAEAQDLTQEFFARLLEKNLLAIATPERGRFRSFLLVSLKHFLINEAERARAQKRGGGRQPLSIDWQAGEERYLREPIDHHDPDTLFERQWALTAIASALARLSDEWTRAGKSEIYTRLLPFLTCDADGQTCAEAAAELGLSAAAARQIVSRMRKRYRDLLRAEVAATLDHDEDVDAELQQLFAALASPT